MNILCIGAHPDDVEIGMGGAVASFIEQGHSVTLLDLTDGEPTPLGSHKKRMAESGESAKILGVNERITLDLENRFLQDTPDARKKVAAVIRKVRPHLMFVPYWVDAHPDHVAASRLSEASRFTAKLSKTDIPGEPYYPPKVFYFFCLHLALNFNSSFILNTTPFMERKLEAVKAYHSQFRDQNKEGYIEEKCTQIGRHWGSLIRREFGEPFLCREEIGLTKVEEILF